MKGNKETIQINGSSIKILNNKLAFNFAKIGSQNNQQSLIQVESYNGTISINNAADGTEVNIQLVITLVDNSSVLAKSAIGNSYTTVIIGFYTPQIGDFAYADGTFSRYYDPTNQPFGFVYYTKGTENIEVRVMAFDASSEDQPLGMSSETRNESDTGYDNRARVLNFLKKLGITDPTTLELTITPQKTCEPSAHSDLRETTVNYTDNLTAPTILNSGKNITEKYISQANNNISTLLNKDENFAYSDITNSNYSEVIKEFGEKYGVSGSWSAEQEIERTIKQSYDIEDKLIPYYSDIIPSVLINNFSLYLKDGSSLSWEEVEGVIYDCLLNGLSSLKVK